MPGTSRQLAPIPVVDAGPAFPLETLDADIGHAQRLMDVAVGRVPRPVLRGLDAISRRWLVAQSNEYLPEIDELSRRLGRPGCHFLSVNYEWGCTVTVGPSPDGQSARMVRTLDWRTPGLGRYVMAARVASAAGPFVTFAWPGFVGVLQAMAPGRFSAALNQAPLRRYGGGLFALDWLAGKVRVWNEVHPPPLHVLRRVMETARDYAEARRMLAETPIAAAATFSLAGTAPGETCIIERTEERACVLDGPGCAANHWRALDHGAHSRGVESARRHAASGAMGPVDFDPAFPWLKEPVLNHETRLVMVADAKLGRVVAQGFEHDGPATEPLALTMPHAASSPAQSAAE